MNYNLALVGGEEFAPGFEPVHAALVRALDRPAPRALFIPTAAAHDGVVVAQSWCDKARASLAAAGAIVDAPLVLDRDAADDPRVAELAENADLVYFGGGWPNDLIHILSKTRLLDAVWRAAERGALIAGASAGAMALGARSIVLTPELNAALNAAWGRKTLPPDWNPPQARALECWNVVPHVEVTPHYDVAAAAFGRIQQGLFPADDMMVGIDEQTAMVRWDGKWRVLGRGGVTVGLGGEMTRYGEGEVVPLEQALEGNRDAVDRG